MRDVTEKESLRILKTALKGTDTILGVNWVNHRTSDLFLNTYQVTADILSLGFLMQLLEHKRIKNLYWHPSVSPPNTGVDSIAMRYRLYIQYYQVQSRKTGSKG